MKPRILIVLWACSRPISFKTHLFMESNLYTYIALKYRCPIHLSDGIRGVYINEGHFTWGSWGLQYVKPIHDRYWLGPRREGTLTQPQGSKFGFTFCPDNSLSHSISIYVCRRLLLFLCWREGRAIYHLKKSFSNTLFLFYFYFAPLYILHPLEVQTWIIPFILTPIFNKKNVSFILGVT